jgi:hypothetical protein
MNLPSSMEGCWLHFLYAPTSRLRMETGTLVNLVAKTETVS